MKSEEQLIREIVEILQREPDEDTEELSDYEWFDEFFREYNRLN